MDIIIPVLLLTASGFIFSILIVLASKIFKTEEADIFEKIRSCLPGINCSVCGYASCDEYARGIIKGDIKTKCRPGGKSTQEKLEDVLEEKK